MHRRPGAAQEQAPATREVVEPLGRAGAEPGEFLVTVVDRAARIHRAHAGQHYLADCGAFGLGNVFADVTAAFVRSVQVKPILDEGVL